MTIATMRHPSELDPSERFVLRAWGDGLRGTAQIARHTGIAKSSVVRAMANLWSCGLICDPSKGGRDDPDPSPAEQAEIEARIERLRRVKVACRRQYADSGMPDDVLDLVLPPETVRKGERRRA